MTSFPPRPDVVVIGAGAAGIAAGRELTRLGLSCVILEARDRIGGRAHTLAHGTSAPLDLGCEWLHSADRNILAAIAPGLGFGLDKATPPWARPSRQPHFDAEAQEAFGLAFGAFHDRLREAAEAAISSGRDRPAAALLDPACRWNGLMDAISTYYNGAPLARVSVIDYDTYLDTEVNWRVRGGYGALIATLGRDLPIRCGCAVRLVDATGRSVMVGTDTGSIETDAVIVTVPTSVLAGDAITFRPAIDDNRMAASVLPLGVAEKLYFLLDRPEAYEPDTRLVAATDRVDTGSYTFRPFGRPMIEGYFGGDHARALGKAGFAAFADAGLSEIAGALGHDILRHLHPLMATGWAHDPLSGGSYSHALPGHAAARAALAKPAFDRIFFAGEATSPQFFSTAHGAFETGLAAAHTIGSYIKRHRNSRRD